jgi:hypothetical protein
VKITQKGKYSRSNIFPSRKLLRISLKTAINTGWREICEQAVAGREMVGKFFEVIYE